MTGLSRQFIEKGPPEVADCQILGDLWRSRNFKYHGPQNFGCDSEMKCVSNDYTNPNTSPMTLTALTLTLTLRPSQRLS